jgi:hypothetical protein
MFVYVVLRCSFRSFVPLHFAFSTSELRVSARVCNMYWSSPKWDRIGSEPFEMGQKKKYSWRGSAPFVHSVFTAVKLIDKAK